MKSRHAAAKLNPEEQVEFFRWWVETETFKQRHLAALKRDLAAGLNDLDSGRYETYDDAGVMRLAEDVVQSGRKRLKQDGKERRAIFHRGCA